MRLIDADRMKAYIDAQKGRPFIGCTIGEALKIMTDEQPTVEAETVQHGKWIRIYSRPGVFKYLGWTCDKCGQRTGNEYAPQYYKRCPYCGAKMDGEQHD